MRLVDVPTPLPGPAEVLVAPSCSLISPGTERSVRTLASSGLLAKARARPDLVRDVVRKARGDGVDAAWRAVRDGLDREVPLGYSSAGTVLEVGAAVAGLRPGQRVAAAGAGHGERQLVAGLLAVPIPEGVRDEHAAFAALGAVALHGVRAGDVQAGSRVVVVGMGVLGRLVCRAAAASGASVLAVDVRSDALGGPDPVEAAVLDEGGTSVVDAVAAWSAGRGADVVLVAADDHEGGAVGGAPALLRDHGRVVVLGDAVLQLDRRAWYERALQLEVVRSYGPGRYDPSYEQLGVDHPAGYAPWTAGRNLETFLHLLDAGVVDVAPLLGHRVPFDEVERAYGLVEHDRRPVAVQLVYDTAEPIAAPTARVGRPEPSSHPRLGVVGSGTFVRRTLLPALRASGWDEPVAVASRTGRAAEALGVGEVRSVDELVQGPDLDVVAVACSHDAHARLVVEALAAGRHVYCEKPLALDAAELAAVEEAWASSAGSLLVGFNRRHSEAVRRAREHLVGVGGPLVLTYRAHLAPLPAAHWYHDRRQGGRLVGEVCHFIDTAIALVGSDVRRVAASGAAPPGVELLLADHLVVVLEHVDGSLSTIATGSGHASTAKERIEVLGGGRTVLVDDFAELRLDGHRHRLGRTDRKGHAAQLRAFREDLVAGRPWSGQAAGLHSSRVVVAAAEALLTGEDVTVPASQASDQAPS